AIELADLNLCARSAAGDVHAAEGDDLLEQRALHTAGDDAHLRPALMHAVAVAGGLAAGELEADEDALRMLLTLQQRVAAYELFVALEGDGEADAGLEGIGLVAEFVAEEDQAGLDAHPVARFQADGAQTVRLARLPHRVPHGRRVLRMAEDLVAELAGVSGGAHPP